MEFKGLKVRHSVFGEGRVLEEGGGYIRITFGRKEKSFSFPGAFARHIRFEDPEAQSRLEALLKLDQKEQQAEELREQERMEETLKRLANPPQRTAGGGSRRAANDNVAFKCIFCDGGSNSGRTGFLGVCSDRNIRQNIQKDRRVWCGDPDCACRQYLDGQIDRIALDARAKAGEFICYESALFREWTARAGRVQRGEKRGTPMRMRPLQPGSLCALTTRLPGSREEERQVFAVFLVGQSFEGDGQEEGYVQAHERYRLELSPEEAASMPFWRYHSNDGQPHKAHWGSGLQRYFGTRQAALMLRDIVRLREGKPGEALAKEMYSRYCEQFGIEESTLGEPTGALRLQ